MTDFRPMCIRFVKETRKDLKYEMQDNDVELEISSVDRKLAIDFLYLSNGKEKLDIIAKELKVKIAKLMPLVNILLQHNIVLDSRQLFKFYQEVESIPGPFLNEIKEDIVKTLRKSQSHNAFGEEVLTFEKILKILSGLRVDKDRSASFFSCENYPLEFFIVLNHSYGKFEAGLYKFNSDRNELINLNKSSSVKLNNFLFTSDITTNSSVIIFVVAYQKLLNYLYANRAYRYLFLESGHVTQRACQFAIKEKVHLFECREFNDNAISLFLNLDATQFCSTTLILGAKTKKNSKSFVAEDKVDKLSKFLTKKKLIRSIRTRVYQTGDYAMLKYVTMAMSSKNSRNNRSYTACGVAETIIESKLKCLVEMYERYACSILRTDKEIIYNNQDNFFSISLHAPQHKSFLHTKKLKRIDIGKKVKCVNAVGLQDNKKYLVPIDEVFYPNEKAMFYKANSSGVAAHYNKDLAIQNTLYELIERDAVLVTWYGKRIPNILDNSLLSEDIRIRMENLKKMKVEVNFLDLTVDSCAVVLCLIHNHIYPKTSLGCSANIEIDKAIGKSLDEAELMLNSWNEEAETNRFVEIKDVENVIDHGNIFARIDLKKSEYKWILSGKKTKQVKQPINDFKGLIKKFEPKLININKKRDLGLYVVRLMSQKLLPLTFGFGGEHYGHNRLKEIELNWGSEYPSLPHFIP